MPLSRIDYVLTGARHWKGLRGGYPVPGLLRGSIYLVPAEHLLGSTISFANMHAKHQTHLSQRWARNSNAVPSTV